MLTAICGQWLRTFGTLLRIYSLLLSCFLASLMFRGLGQHRSLHNSGSEKTEQMCPHCKKRQEADKEIDDEIRGVKENDTVKTERERLEKYRE